MINHNFDREIINIFTLKNMMGYFNVSYYDRCISYICCSWFANVERLINTNFYLGFNALLLKLHGISALSQMPGDRLRGPSWWYQWQFTRRALTGHGVFSTTSTAQVEPLDHIFCTTPAPRTLLKILCFNAPVGCNESFEASFDRKRYIRCALRKCVFELSYGGRDWQGYDSPKGWRILYSLI